MAFRETKRILFFAENVTTAQVSRLMSLAESLPADRFEVHFAAAEFSPTVFAGTSFRRHQVYSLPREQMLASVTAGKQVYDSAVLSRYLEEEHNLLRGVRPDLVVGNFRPSLTVSAPLAGVPLATVINAHWSPFSTREAFPIPDHPTVKLVGLEVARRFLPKALPAAFSLFAKPVNGLRKKHGLSPIGDLRDVMTWGDLVLYPDTPELAPTRDAPSTHHYLGPVLWSAPVELPVWWDELRPDRPTVYVTLGSSGSVNAWPELARGLAGLPVNVMVATAGRIPKSQLPPSFYAVELIPGAEAVGRADLVITNGGSGSSYQALADATPVIGVASNLDQHLAMEAVVNAGAGSLLRAGNLTEHDVRVAVTRMLDSEAHADAARRVSARMASWDAHGRFVNLVERTLRAPDALATG